MRFAQPGYGYLSSHDPRAHFGLPQDAEIEAIVVRWPDGTEEHFDGVATDQAIVLEKGSGR